MPTAPNVFKRPNEFGHTAKAFGDVHGNMEGTTGTEIPPDRRMNQPIENTTGPNPTTEAWCSTDEPGDCTVGEFHDVTEAIVTAVGSVTSRDPLELPPLNAVIDVDALEELFAPKVDGTRRPRGTVSFSYCDCWVTVHGTDRVYVTREE